MNTFGVCQYVHLNHYILNIQVLYEDNHLIAVSKPPGILVQGDATGDPTLADWVKQYIKDRYNKPGAVFLGIVHRLDRPVSGVVIFARTTKALKRMNEMFRDRKITKSYWAITKNRPEKLSGELVHYLVKDSTKNKVKAYERPNRKRPNAKKAELSYKTAGVLGSHSFLEVNPITGRPHQIRVQLASMDCIIKGDLKYGADSPGPEGGIYLHCHCLEFIHPVKKEPVKICTDAPNWQMWREFGLV